MEKFFLILLSCLVLTSCSNNHISGTGTTYHELINQYKNYAYEDGYKVHVFIEKNPIPYVVDELSVLQNYKKFDGMEIHRSIDSAIKKDIDYITIFSQDSYPFFLIISKEEVELVTNSTKDIISFFKKEKENTTSKE